MDRPCLLYTSGNNGILLVVDGLERDNNWQALKYITPEEVESVSVLRDAAALALYGYRGVNGVVNIVTKRGKYDTREINFSYDHAFNYMTRKPELADSYTYASALNLSLIHISLTKDLVELHEGTITVESEEGQGTEFIIRLPIDRSYFREEQIDDEVILSLIHI